MKLHLLRVLLVITFMSFVAVGCSNGTETPQKTTETKTVAEGQRVTLPEEQPALFGKVKDVVGNEVTVFAGGVGQYERTPNEESLSEDVQEKMQAIREDIQSGKITPEQAQQELQKLGLQVNRTEDRANGMQFTEETETFIIPVGTPIVTMDRGSNEVKQVELTDIKKDTILRVWKNDDTVSFVQVMGGGTVMRNREGIGGQGPGAGGYMGPGMGGPPVIITQ